MLAALVCLLLAALYAPATYAQESSGTVKGIVVDWQYARILPTTIVFVGTSVKEKVRVDHEGSFEIELPAGDYLVKTTAPGFLERRVRFRVEPNAVRTLNMMLDVRPMKVGKCPRGSLCL
jgi:hypothetical protein